MAIGALKIELFISDSNSLKDKRAVIKALKDKVRNNFNVSISEIDEHDKWQKADIGIVTIGPDNRYVNGVLDKALNYVRANREIHIVDYQLEIL